MKKKQLTVLGALAVLTVLFLTACGNPFFPKEYQDPPMPDTPAIRLSADPSGPYVNGESVALTAAASVRDGGSLSYKWYRNNKNSASGGTLIDNEIGTTYSTATISNSDNLLEPSTTYYYVQVTNTVNGKTTSASSKTVDVTVYNIPIGTNAVREIGVNLTPPVKDAPVLRGAAALSDVTLEGGSGYSCTNVDWQPALHNQFMSGGKYTVNVTLKADEGYTLIALRTATINGQAAAREMSPDGNTVLLSHTFDQVDVRVVTDITVKTQPSTLSYTHGDTLDLAGLVVTLDYDSGDPEDIPFSSFASRIIETNPSHGIMLSHTGHNGVPITVTCNMQTDDTNPLTVNKAQIDTAWVGITPPAKNEAVDYSASVVSEAYTTSNVTWSPTNFSNGEFVGNTVYTASVTITAEADYDFAASLSANINNSTALVTGSGNTRNLSFEFPKTLTGTVANITVTGPTKLSYTHGDTLDLTGLVVTVSFEEPNEPNVAYTFPDDAAAFQTLPAHNQEVLTTMNGTRILVNYSGKNAYSQGSLIVGRKALTLDVSQAKHTKVYDGNTTASNITGITLVGIVGQDNVYIDNTAISGVYAVNGVYTNANAGTTTLNITSVRLAGLQATSYEVINLPVNNVTVTGGITPATPVITTAPTASDMYMGNMYNGSAQALSTSTLSGGSATGLGGAAVAGSFAWVSPTTVPASSGNQSYQVRFTPTSGNYNSPATVNVSVAVYHRIQFNSNGGNTITDKYIKPDTDGHNLFSMPTRAGYIFAGWYTDNTTFRNPLNVNPTTASATVYAQWISPSTITEEMGNSNMNMAFVQGKSIPYSTFTADQTTVTVYEGAVSSFYLGKYEVSQAQWKTVMGDTYNPSTMNFISVHVPAGNYTADDLPVENVTWYDAVEFCNKLTERDTAFGSTLTARQAQRVYTITNRVPASGYPITSATVTADWSKKGYRLPTWYEQVYAATRLGDARNNLFPGGSNSNHRGWTDINGGGYKVTTTYPVVIIQNVANDLNALSNRATIPVSGNTTTITNNYVLNQAGNVSEWCWDWWTTGFDHGGTNPKGLSSGTIKTAYGSNVFSGYRYGRSNYRISISPEKGNNLVNTAVTDNRYYIGLRVARNVR